MDHAHQINNNLCRTAAQLRLKHLLRTRTNIMGLFLYRVELIDQNLDIALVSLFFSRALALE
ncbi:hypothetical protein YC2023_079696 [Brassica napus]